MKLFGIDLFTLDFLHIILTLVISLVIYQAVRLKRSLNLIHAQMEKLEEVVEKVLQVEQSGSDYRVREKKY